MRKKSIFIFVSLVGLLFLALTSLEPVHSGRGEGDPCDHDDDRCVQRIYGTGEPDDPNYLTYGSGIRVMEQDMECVSNECQPKSGTEVEKYDCSNFNNRKCGEDIDEDGFDDDTVYKVYYSVYDADEYDQGDDDRGCCLPMYHNVERCSGDNSFCTYDGDALCQSTPEVQSMESTTLDELDYCGGLDDYLYLSWEIESETDHEITSVELELAEDSNFDDPVYEFTGSGSEGSVNVLDYVDYDTHYEWRIRAEDEYGNATDWQYSSFQTLGERANPRFSFSPAAPIKEEVITFTNRTDAGDYEIEGYEWTFEGGSPDSITQDPDDDDQVETEFHEDGNTTVILEVEEEGFDENCRLERSDIMIRPEMPEWQEVDPFN